MQTKEEKAAYQKKYRAEHKDVIKASKSTPEYKAWERKYRLKNKEKHTAYAKVFGAKYYVKNKKELLAKMKTHRNTPEGRAWVKTYRNKNAVMYREAQWRKSGIDMNYWNYQLYLDMLKAQNYKCIGCKTGIVATKEQIIDNKKLAVPDHNHNTGRVRFLLCNNCNAGMGFLGDDSAVLGNLKTALERIK